MSEVQKNLSILRETLEDSILTPAERLDLLEQVADLQAVLLGLPTEG